MDSPREGSEGQNIVVYKLEWNVEAFSRGKTRTSPSLLLAAVPSLMRAQITFEFSLVELEWISARDFGVSSRTDIMTFLAWESWELSGAGLDIAIIMYSVLTISNLCSAIQTRQLSFRYDSFPLQSVCTMPQKSPN